MSNTSTIHIKTDFDCKVYDYGQGLGTTKADTYFNIELRKGEHELTFVFTGDDSIFKTIYYLVKDTDCDYRLIVEIAESICDKAKEYFDSENYSVAFALYSLAAEKGLAEAQNGLGNCYFSGHGVEKKHITAVEWYLNAAEQGYAEAQWHLGFCYRFGSGVEQNLANAVAYFTKAAENGYALAQNLLGRFNEIGELINKDLIMAAKWYAKAAEQGLASAQHSLGRCYYNGIGVKKNIIEAVRLFTLSAEQGYVLAQHNLGLCYYNGIEVEKDIVAAVRLFTLSAEQGYVLAQHDLGLCYYNGNGVERDLVEAVKWWTKAAEQGFAKAQCKLGACYFDGSGIEKDISKAVEWWTKAAEQGFATAQDCLGYCYYYGDGVEKDLAKAVELWTKAASQGIARSQKNLGICYYNGTSIEKNLAKATEWFNKAAEQGNEDAKDALNLLKSIETKPIHYLFFDTETAGLPKDYNALTHWLKNWPRLVQLSWITTDEDCNILSENDYIIYPDGFTIPEEAVRLHGITTEIAKEKGKPLKEVVDKFMEDFNAATTIVGHNIDFDKKIIGAELIRLEQNDIMSSKEALCTMKGSVDYCKIPSSHGYKWPKLQELHKKLFGCEFEDAHNSMSDVKATLKCFKEMKERGLFPIKKKGLLTIKTQSFTREEITTVERNEIVASQHGKSVCFYLKGGGMTFIPLSSNSSKGVGESINLETAKILTISKHGDDDHMEVED